MEFISPGLAGHRGLRGDVLLELKKAQPLTAKELGERFGVSANAVRRHLKELEAEGLVDYGREQRGNGAPTFAYRLSADGEALFPNQYEEALTRLLQHVVQTEGREAAAGVLEQLYMDLRRRLGGRLEGMTPVDRVKLVAGVLGEAGYMAEHTVEDDEVHLTIHNCAIRAAATCVPEVCDTEQEFLQDVLSALVERKTHIMDGCNACQYQVKFGELTEPAV